MSDGFQSTSSASGSGLGSHGLLPPLTGGLRNRPDNTTTVDDLLGSEPGTYGAYMHPLDDDSLKTLITVFAVTEVRNGGWVGEVVVLPPAELTASVEDAFFGATVMDILPGNGVLLHLLGTQELSDTNALRTWPSAVLSLQTVRGTREYTPAYRAQVADPLTLLADQRIWGVYVEESIGRIVGGAIGLALGGRGDATLTPAMGTRLPAVEIRESVRSELQAVPLAVAAGAELGDWLQDLLARLGARLELRPDGSKVVVHVTDAKPVGEPLSLALVASHHVDEANAALVAMGAVARENSRAAVLDNRVVGDAERSQPRGSVGRVIDAMYIEAEEAWVRAAFEEENDFLGSSTITVASMQSNLVPGQRIEFDETVFGTAEWQVATSLHKFTNGLYRNVAKLQKDGTPWRGQRGPIEQGITVTAVVDDGKSSTGTTVPRDRLGRIPVRLSFLKGGEGESLLVDDVDVEQPEWIGDPVSLPLLEAIGSGAAHGFVSAHRQGDPCRVVVHTPLNAEIVGFAYRQDGRVAADLANATGGLVVGHDVEGFSGLVFRPDEDLDEELQAAGSSTGSAS